MTDREDKELSLLSIDKKDVDGDAGTAVSRSPSQLGLHAARGVMGTDDDDDDDEEEEEGDADADVLAWVMFTLSDEALVGDEALSDVVVGTSSSTLDR